VKEPVYINAQASCLIKDVSSDFTFFIDNGRLGSSPYILGHGLNAAAHIWKASEELAGCVFDDGK